MPELPEVEALTRQLDAELRGDVVARCDVVSISVLKTFHPPPTALHGLAVNEVRRIGKHVDIVVGELHLVVHLARAGWIAMRAVDRERPTPRGKGPLAMRLILSSGQAVDLTDAALKKRVSAWLVHDPADVPTVASLGPDPLSESFDAEAFDHVLTGSGGAQIKGILRDQSLVAGIGNAYSDEILHVAGLSPFARASALTQEQRAVLFMAMKTTLGVAVSRADNVALRDLKDDKRQSMRVHGRTGQECPVCADTVREVSFKDSTLQYCATCQTGGTPLKDRTTSKFLK